MGLKSTWLDQKGKHPEGETLCRIFAERHRLMPLVRCFSGTLAKQSLTNLGAATRFPLADYTHAYKG